MATKMQTPRERRQTAEMQASDVYGMLDGDGSWSELHRRVIYTREQGGKEAGAGDACKA